MDRTIAQTGNVKLVRSALGQVVDYDVHVGSKLIFSGSKREARKVYDREAKKGS